MITNIPWGPNVNFLEQTVWPGAIWPLGPNCPGPMCPFFTADSWAPDNVAPGPNWGGHLSPRAQQSGSQLFGVQVAWNKPHKLLVDHVAKNHVDGLDIKI